MRREWKNLKTGLMKSAKYGLVAIGISFLFFLVNLPSTPKTEIKVNFLANMAISVFIALLITAMFALVHLYYSFQEIKTGIRQELKPLMGFAVSFAGMTLGLFIGLTVRARILDEKPDFSYLGTALLSGAFISLAFVFYGVYRESQKKYEVLKEETVQAQYNVLKSQMQPHFLFNSLNSVTELIESDKANAAKMTQKLSDLYREILENSKQTTVSLASEASIVKKYLELEKFRFGERLSFSINIPDDAAQIFLPSLILQTLVENSIKHAISKAIEGGEILIDASRESVARIKVSVKNSGEPFKQKNGGTGLSNTVSRLGLLYGTNHNFNIGQDGLGRTVISFCVTGAKVG